METYLQILEAHGKSAVDTRHRAQAHIYPVMGTIEVATLSTDLLRKWHAGLSKALRRTRTKPGKPQQHRRDCAPGRLHESGERDAGTLGARIPGGGL